MAKDKSPKNKEWQPDICEYKHELVEKDQKILDEKIKNLAEQLTHIDNKTEEKLDEIKNDINIKFDEIKTIFKEDNSNLKNQIKMTKELLHNKIDEIDTVIRGDLNTGKIGLLEKIRDLVKQVKDINSRISNYIKNIKLSTKIIIMVILFLLGGRIFGVSLDGIQKIFHKNHPPEVKIIETPVENKGKSTKN